MENKANNNVGIFLFIIIFGTAFIAELGFIGMIIGYILMTSYMNNFVLKPLAKIMSVKNYTPNNYMYMKLQNIRLVIWIISAFLRFPLIFIIENIALAISVSKINEIKQKLGIPIKSFSKHDYLIYEEYWKYSENDEYNEYEPEESDEGYTQKREYTYNDVKDENKKEILEDKENLLRKEIEVLKEEIRKNIPDDSFFLKSEKFDFDKPVGDIPKVEPIKINTSMQGKTEPAEDEIRCEKCGTIMSKMKIACPKCGALVKNSYRSGK